MTRGGDARRGAGKEPAQLQIYDPYFCNGAVARHLAKLGFPLCYNRNEDFYAVLASGALGQSQTDGALRVRAWRAGGIGQYGSPSDAAGGGSEVHSCIQSSCLGRVLEYSSTGFQGYTHLFFWGWKRHVSIFPLHVLPAFVHAGRMPRHLDWMQDCPSFSFVVQFA